VALLVHLGDDDLTRVAYEVDIRLLAALQPTEDRFDDAIGYQGSERDDASRGELRCPGLSERSCSVKAWRGAEEAPSFLPVEPMAGSSFRSIVAPTPGWGKWGNDQAARTTTPVAVSAKKSSG
jgi:hypothetical protein